MKNRLKYLLITFGSILLLLPLTLKAQTKDDFKKEHFIFENDTLNYRILYPKNFSEEEEEYPVVLVLHGAGERGDDNEAQLVHGSDLFLKAENREKFGSIVIFPQAPKEDYWAKVEVKRDTMPFQFDFKNKEKPTKSLNLVMKLMDSLVAEEFVNEKQVYVGGLSMGGMGTYEILYKRPDMFAAAFAICGGANPEIASEYQDGLNIWIFHGEKDDVVPPELSKDMARDINHHGGNAKLSLYPNDNHNSWDSAFAEPYLLPWLFSIQKQ
ncbi:prolyl oligopeptidase family serine peptidase [Christiangramia forsetii]|uniref:Secreted alpha/beta fold hydrolase-possibly a phospholipase/carboxylesterase n=2 Tax=Christiangramia forsetii TaxID=411153 RepID=A0LYA6_CHRFK|nr:prolyl oligopeptidase family serine peptidase [Christiangramia forsetii]GGG34685.1 phospholipase [Christiangramia forsetii]CAL65351.1 secreted alpha/beta fold hydrolase-possibly a phospholipase/carboxylesterase [Christiangramia forsetii KT0803]